MSMSWHQANQHYLTAALAMVRGHLERYAERTERSGMAVPEPDPSATGREALTQASAAIEAPASLDRLCAALHLSDFERDVLLLCAGVELDAGFMALLSALPGKEPQPSFSLALAALPDAHWSALSPDAALRRWHLVEVGRGTTLTASTLRIDERILQYLTGINHLDERLSCLMRPLPAVLDLAPSHQHTAGYISTVWSRTKGDMDVPVIQLCGEDRGVKEDIAAAACATLGLKVHRMPAWTIPTSPAEVDLFIRLWEREAFLSLSALYIDAHDFDPHDMSKEAAFHHILEHTLGILLVGSTERRALGRRLSVAFDIDRPSPNEQRDLWLSVLGEDHNDLDGQVERLTQQFSLSPHDIRTACAQTLGLAVIEKADLSTALWDACRRLARPRLEGLAQRIEPKAVWDDLVLPEDQKRVLKEITAHIRQRVKVHETWGFAGKCSRGLGMSALFVGMSGTGKTMAAEVMANELKLDLYRIDLSQVVNKYIGETEKNLKRVFDAAEYSGAILLFDEADALFGKRSEVKDSHDRYANIEVSYLLQRMESYRGLAILTTNMKEALDHAFLRRIRFIVHFPFPDAAFREEIWRHVFPAATPTNGLDAHKLARLAITGGNIRNIALSAAFLAADERTPVDMRHIRKALKGEYAKMEKPLGAAEQGIFE